MKTSELVKAVAMETGLTASATEKDVNAVFSAIKKEVGAGRQGQDFQVRHVLRCGTWREGRPRSANRSERRHSGAATVSVHQSITFKRELNV